MTGDGATGRRPGVGTDHDPGQAAATGRHPGSTADHDTGRATAAGRRPGATADHDPGRNAATGRGIVYLVGAGPGDPELITVRGLRCLRQADVVVYDRLIDARLLAEAPPAARRVYAGKAPGRQALRQEEIQALLVRQARAGRVVVRLKGGDPFVFGRGGEEALACSAAGVPWEAVPGVTSAVAVPALAGIPLTQRGVAASFAVVTGHSAGDAGLDWSALARIETLVVLMGAARLGEIAARLASHGKPPETPVAVIENGSRESERVLIGTLGDIAAVAAAAGLASPATIVIGEVVRLRPALAPAASCLADTPAGRRFA